MSVTIHTIDTTLREYFSTTIINSSAELTALTRWEVLLGQHSSASPDTLYVADRLENLLCMKESSKGNLVFCTLSEYDNSQMLQVWQGNILVVHTDRANDVTEKIRLVFSAESRKNELSAVLMNVMLEGKNVQALTDAAYPFLQNPIIVFNSAYRIVGVTRAAVQAQESETSDLLLENGGFSSSDYVFANRDALHSRVKRSKTPILAFHEDMKSNQLLIAIHPEKDYGHIVVNEFEHSFSEADSELLMTFRGFVFLQMKQEELQHQNSNRASEHFILDLLDETIIVSSSYQAFIHQLDYTFPETMRCLQISTELTPGAINLLQVRNQIDYLFPNSKVVVYEKKIVALLPVPKSGKIQEIVLASFRSFCEKSKLYAALSNSFSDVMELRLYFKQSLRALEAGRTVNDVPGLYVYEDYYLVHLRDLFLQKESLEVFLCPAFKRLTGYDLEHHTELAFTLYMYLLNDRNLVQTAKTMNMHRSSLIYRFDKINELLGEIPASIAERQYYILSYQFSEEHYRH